MSNFIVTKWLWFTNFLSLKIKVSSWLTPWSLLVERPALLLSTNLHNILSGGKMEPLLTFYFDKDFSLNLIRNIQEVVKFDSHLYLIFPCVWSSVFFFFFSLSLSYHDYYYHFTVQQRLYDPPSLPALEVRTSYASCKSNPFRGYVSNLFF